MSMHTPAIEPPHVLPESWDRRLYGLIHGLPHSPAGDRYVAMLSDAGEGAGWVATGIALAWLGGRKGRRAGIAVTVAAIGTTYLAQRIVKPIFRRQRPWVGRDVAVVGIRTSDASFPSGHSAASFAAATALTAYYPRSAPLVYTVATAVAASRVHLGHHFPSDTVAGALLGIVSGALVAWLTKKPATL